MKSIVALPAVLFMAFTVNACDRMSGTSTPLAYNNNPIKLATVPAGYATGDVTFSPDGHRIAIALKKDGKEAMFMDSKQGSFYDNVRAPVFRKDRTGHGFAARKGAKECVVADGREGALYDAVDRLAFAPDGRVIYTAKRGDKWLMVAGAREGSPFDETTSLPVISPDGKRLAYVEQHNDVKKSFLRICSMELKDCVKGKEYDSIGAIRNDDARSRLVYAVIKEGKSAVVSLDFSQPGLKETEGNWYDEISAFDISENGQHRAFLARRDGKTLLVRDGAEEPVPPYDTAFDLVVSPNGRTVYTGMVQGRVVAFVDGRRLGKEYDGINNPVFSPDGSNVAFTADSGAKSVIVVNGVEGPLLDKVVTPKFTPDGSRLVYRARNNGERFVVVADLNGKTLKEHPHYEAVWDLVFSPDGRSVGYGVKTGQEFWWKVEKLQ